MKVYVQYDSEGTIHSLLFGDAPSGGGFGVVPKPGTFVAEVDGVEIPPGDSVMDSMRQILQTHEVARPFPRCTLKRRQVADTKR